MEVLTSLITILLIVVIGMLSRKTGIFKAEHAKTLSSFVYYFGLPALFFIKLSSLDLNSLDPNMVIGTLLPTVMLLLVLLILKGIKLIQKDTYILLSLSISFGSYAFFGVAFFETFQGGKWLEMAILAASLLGVLGIITTLSLLEYANQQKQSGSFFSKIFTNPLILSILIGIAASLAGVQVDFLSNALSLVGQTSSAIAIFVLGMFIYDRFTPALFKQAFLLSIFRMVGLPLAAFLTIRFILTGSSDMGNFLMLENSMPAAIALVVFAERYDYKVSETAGIVSLTSIFSFLGITGVYYLSQYLF
jgi:predicted permease